MGFAESEGDGGRSMAGLVGWKWADVMIVLNCTLSAKKTSLSLRSIQPRTAKQLLAPTCRTLTPTTLIPLFQNSPQGSCQAILLFSAALPRSHSAHRSRSCLGKFSSLPWHPPRHSHFLHCQRCENPCEPRLSSQLARSVQPSSPTVPVLLRAHSILPRRTRYLSATPTAPCPCLLISHLAPVSSQANHGACMCSHVRPQPSPSAASVPPPRPTSTVALTSSHARSQNADIIPCCSTSSIPPKIIVISCAVLNPSDF